MTTVTGIFKISSVLWTDHMRYSLVTMKFVRWPVCSHMKIILHSISKDRVDNYLTDKYKKMYKDYIESDKSSPRIELELVSQLRLFHFKHTALNYKSTFYVLDYFPLFSDSLELELTLCEHKTTPEFLKDLIEDNLPMKIGLIHGIYQNKQKIPKQMIMWMSKMQSNRAIRTACVKKYNTYVDWENLAEKDIEMIPNFREPRMNYRSKRFIRNVIKDILDKDTAKLAPWVNINMLRLLSPLEKNVLVRSVEANIENSFDFNFNIYSAQLFQLWFGHEPDKDFEDALAFKKYLKNNMYGLCPTGPNKYICKIDISVKQFVGASGSMGVTGNEDTENKTFYTLKRMRRRYENVIERFLHCDITLGSPSVPEGKCIIYHPDDAVYWRQIVDVDEVFNISQIKHSFPDVDEITIFNAHKLDFQHWILLNMYLKSSCIVHICGRLDQYCTGRIGQVFRDLCELKGINSIPQHNLHITSNIHFVKGIKNLPKEVEQVFTSSWSKLKVKLPRQLNKIWLFKPKRIRTIFSRNDGGWTVFKESEEPARRIYDLDKYKNADIVPVNEWNGRLLDVVAFIPDPEIQNNFDLYTVRTFARKIYYINMKTLPSDNGRLPSRRTLRHTLNI